MISTFTQSYRPRGGQPALEIKNPIRKVYEPVKLETFNGKRKLFSLSLRVTDRSRKPVLEAKNSVLLFSLRFTEPRTIADNRCYKSEESIMTVEDNQCEKSRTWWGTGMIFLFTLSYSETLR